MGLPRHDFHVTLGFEGKDVHGVPKDSTTILVHFEDINDNNNNNNNNNENV